jgi:thermitase
MPTRKTIATSLLAVALLALPAVVTAKTTAPKFRDGEVLVRFKKGNDGPAADAVKKIGAKVLERLSRIDVSRLGLPKDLPVEAALEQLKRFPFVEFAEPNYIYRASWKTSDPFWDEQWGVAKIKAASAWGLQTGSDKIVIAILDTGVDLDHPDLVKKLVAGYDFIDGDDQPDDVAEHGTHCAGIAAAQTNNGVGVAGICPNCKIMPVRVLGADGGLASDVAKGIIWAVDHGAKVISMSLGGLYESTAQSDAIDYAWDKGAVIVAASGNFGTADPHYPSYHEKCIAVGATEKDDARADYSNYGSWVDVAAPGTLIASTVPGGYAKMSGTSMATPFVAGLAGLVWSAMGTSASNTKVRAAIENGCDPIGDWLSGGRINARRSIELANAEAAKTPAAAGNTSGGTTSSKGSSSGSGSSGTSSAGADGFAPGYFKIAQGSSLGGDLSSLAKSDDALVVARSTQTGKKRYADVQTSIKTSGGTSAKSIEISVEARFYAADSPVAVYRGNFTTSAWDSVGNGAVKTADTSFKVSRSTPKPYIGANGEVRVRLAAESDWWATFDFGVDLLRVFYK